MLREKEQNTCLNQKCLSSECQLMEARNTILSLFQQVDELYLQLLDKEGEIDQLKSGMAIEKQTSHGQDVEVQTE